MPDVLISPSARDLTRDYMSAQMSARGHTQSWDSAVPDPRPDEFFTLVELNSTSSFSVLADSQLLAIRFYGYDEEAVSRMGRLIKSVWLWMPDELMVQNVEHAGGPGIDTDPEVPLQLYSQVTAWVTVMTHPE